MLKSDSSIIKDKEKKKMSYGISCSFDVKDLFKEHDVEANSCPGRHVTVSLPDGNVMAVTIDSLQTALELKQSLFAGYNINLSDLEVVLYVKENEMKSLKDFEEFGDELFGFDEIRIRDKKNHQEMLEALKMCINLKPIN